MQEMYVEVVLQQFHIYPCKEHESGLRVPAYKRLKQLDDSKGHILAVRGRAGLGHLQLTCLHFKQIYMQFPIYSTCSGCNALAIT